GESAPPPRRERRHKRWGAQRSPRQRLAFDVVAGLLLGVLLSAWAVSIVAAFRERTQPGRPVAAAAAAATGSGPAARRDPPASGASVARTIGASLTDPRSSSTAYLSDAALNAFVQEMRGQSGKLKAVIRAPNADLADEADPTLAA